MDAKLTELLQGPGLHEVPRERRSGRRSYRLVNRRSDLERKRKVGQRDLVAESSLESPFEFRAESQQVCVPLPIGDGDTAIVNGQWTSLELVALVWADADAVVFSSARTKEGGSLVLADVK
jgi:hypothetical protein